MTDDELEEIVKVLRASLPDGSCRTQLGLLLYHEMKQCNALLVHHLRRAMEADGCPVCGGGDCSAANPPLLNCPMELVKEPVHATVKR